MENDNVQLILAAIDKVETSINTRLDRLNGKVAEHERRFATWDGAQAAKREMREASPQRGITAKLSTRDVIWLLIVIAAIAAGKLDLLAIK